MGRSTRSDSAERPVTIPENYTITVVLPSAPGLVPKEIVLDGRTAKLIAWLVQHRARVERVGTGDIGFDVGLRMFTPHIHERFPGQPGEPEPIPGEA